MILFDGVETRGERPGCCAFGFGVNLFAREEEAGVFFNVAVEGCEMRVDGVTDLGRQGEEGGGGHC